MLHSWFFISMANVSHCISCVNDFLQFFEELATDSKPEKVHEVAVKETQGKQVFFTLKVGLRKVTLCIQFTGQCNFFVLQQVRGPVLCYW